MSQIVKSYRGYKAVILGADFFTQGGAWRSIYAYCRQQELAGEPIHMVNLRGSRNVRQFLAAAAFAPRVIVNAFSAMGQWRVILMCLLRPDVFIYLHETQHFLDFFQRTNPLKYRLIRRIFRRNPILCVSEQAAEHYRSRFQARRTIVVYECPGEQSRPEFDHSNKHIVMVGSIDERKGAELFSRVADLAAANHLAWQFHWVGGVSTLNKLALSERVQWHGWQWEPREFVRRADLFFLSSVDDPCPLAALEALFEQRRCVAYRRTGIAELIEGIGGCAVFEDYTPEASLAGLAKALAADLDTAALKCLAEQKIGLQAFCAQIDKALGGALRA
ncbi:MAG: glycosyltransferase family 4 protein [bacterium]